jgi:hypothetical protein
MLLVVIPDHKKKFKQRLNFIIFHHKLNLVWEIRKSKKYENKKNNNKIIIKIINKN